ncbi:MAG: radical SAM protein [Thermodesulfobacteriota bacterium]|nr:radical SAM protein [Thermodesulfobacteriota bacterium]
MTWKLKEKNRDLVQNEKGVIKKPWGGKKVNWVLGYPNYYHIGMSNLGFLSIYKILNQIPDALCERVFLPSFEDTLEYRKHSTPLFSLESCQPLYQFHLIAFSVSFENDYPNILTMLDLAKIPLKSLDRDNSYPLVIGGGVALTLNPEVLSDFLDLIVIGEGEDFFQKFMEIYMEYYQRFEDKEDLLEKLSQIEGTYAPRFYRKTYHASGNLKAIFPYKDFHPKKIKKRKASVKNPLYSRIQTKQTELGDMFLMEIRRGCNWGCRFCAAGHIFRPPRNADYNNIISVLDESSLKNKKIGLIGTSVSEHPKLNDICMFIKEKTGGFSVSSLRFNTVTKELVRGLKESGHKTVSLAPETGSPGLRKIINKNISDEEIFEAVYLILNEGIKNLKLYFMIGLPFETREDIESIISLCKKVKHIFLKTGKSKKFLGKITLSINPFVPKPWTPFQWHPFLEVEELKKRLKKITNALKKESNIIINFEPPKWSHIQALLSRGDSKVSKILLSVHQNNGNWEKTFREIDINPHFYTYRQREKDEVFPWDIIDMGIKKEFLWEEYQKSLSLLNI